MAKENGALSIDFLIGFTIFLLGFIWVISMIPGLLIGLQAYTVDYDAVAYRTSVILVEDPGEPALPLAARPWEYLTDPRDVVRFGLAISRDTPNVLSQDKVTRFFCTTAFSYPNDYQNKTIFGDYPYRFNISLMDAGGNRTLTLGDVMSPNSSYGTIRRLVKIKGSSYAAINSSNYTNGGDDTWQHDFTILINQSKLLQVSDPIYQINPAKENIVINITNINSTLVNTSLGYNRESCFDINLSKRITVYSRDPNTNTLFTIGYVDTPVIDGQQYNLSFAPPYGVKNNISMTLNPNFIPWLNYKLVYVTLAFDLIKNNIACPSPPNNFTGSQFLNNTFTSPFDYNYDPKNVTQADLRDAVLEVDIGSGFRTATETLIDLLKAKFIWDTPASKTITFRDQSTGSPVSWEWNFGDGTPNGTTSVTTHPYAVPGVYSVTLMVRDTNGVSDSITHTIDLSAPGAAFTGSPLSGVSPMNVQFIDGSTRNPSSWRWEYNKTAGGTWTQFSIAQNPVNTFTNGTYDIRLTATNMFGSNNVTRPAYITAIPLPPVASFNTAPSPATGNAPLVVTFTDTSTGGTPDTWDWDFGDGSPHSNVQNPPAHTYVVAGSYTAQLTVSNAGGSSSATQPVTVSVAVPHVDTFTSSGTWTAPAGVTSVEYLVVGGGGGGGSYGAGGGAGGFRTASGYTVIPGNSYPVMVGTGGAGGTSGGRGTSGNPSIFATTITSAGGGGGAGTSNNNGRNGGSGGGALGAGIGTGTPGQGNNGGTGRSWGSPTRYLGGGGGGAAAAGAAVTGAGTPFTGGVGGAGSFSSITGINTQYAGGGGGGGSNNGGSIAGAGGGGGGGAGAVSSNAGSNGAANTGGGGGGGGYSSGTNYNGGNGGSGIVIIRYVS